MYINCTYRETWCFDVFANIYRYTCTDNLLYGKINREYKKKRQELSRDMSSYKKQWEPCRVNSKQQISMETRFVFTIQINIVESMGLSNYFVSSCSDRIILPIPIFFLLHWCFKILSSFKFQIEEIEKNMHNLRKSPRRKNHVRIQDGPPVRSRSRSKSPGRRMVVC